MYQKQQPLIISSKRNTTYLMPLMNSATTTTNNNNANNLTNSKTNINNENPFPVSHIVTGNGSDNRIAKNDESGSLKFC